MPLRRGPFRHVSLELNFMCRINFELVRVHKTGYIACERYEASFLSSCKSSNFKSSVGGALAVKLSRALSVKAPRGRCGGWPPSLHPTWTSKILFKEDVNSSWYRDINWDYVGININGRKLNYLRFADDLLLISDNACMLQHMVKQLEDASGAVGLTVNNLKTKVMRNRDERPIKIDDKDNENVKQSTYYLRTNNIEHGPDGSGNRKKSGLRIHI
ncbi:Putative uncharacterized transposon-derived protein F52C9.6 [Eumeta japonica]|uniref:Uncharacterized transposon-derived protein F52C9.6 n=1 Tax=Eumeta variegata TaxID=151549 RepID=A0A4C1VN26_EUMVA|nr:Putative uncharacterized transposon-derived protein F52C9.6 [Eumeta japonica]